MLNYARRSFIAASLAAAFAFGSGALAQDTTVNADELHTPGQLGEKILGPADAKVTVVEYASMSCPHCAAFDRDVFDQFKLKYIDSGQVRFIFREFPLNAPAYAVAMLARCAPADKFFDVVHTYFRSQDKWLVQGDVKAKILDIATGFGFTPQTFDACLANQALFKAIDEVRARGAGFGVQGTPTFFVNGKLLRGASTLEELGRAIDPLL
jgi:protein-disulfide isomerase